MEKQSKRKGLRRRLIMLLAPLAGHQNPMLQLAHILHSKGFSITIIHTQFNPPDPLMYPHFKFRHINDGLSAAEYSAAKVDFNRAIVLIMELNQKCVEPLREVLAQLLDEEEEETVACLIVDVIMPFTRVVADAFKLPRIVFRADSQLALPVLDQPQLKVKDMPAIMADNREAFSSFIANMNKETKEASGIICNSFKELEQPQLATIESSEFPPDLNFLVGPTHASAPVSSTRDQDQATGIISWLDSQSPKSIVYVSFGSMAALSEPKFVEMAWGLANSKQRFLWVVRPGSVCGSEWVEKLPKGFIEAVGERGHMIVKWAPQVDVLAHPAIGCFWTHCGWNSVFESIYEGVPMICSPYFGDQLVTAKYIKDFWKIGVQLENGMEREEIEKEIKRIMAGKEGEEIRERAMVLKEKANDCVKEGGSSFMAMERLVNYILSFK